MPDFHCRARSYLSCRLGIKICRIVTRLLLQVLFSLLSCTSMPAIHPCLPSIIYAIHHPCRTPLYSILFHPIPITKFLFLLFSSLPPTGRSSSKLLAKQKPEKTPPFTLHPHISSSLNPVHSIQFSQYSPLLRLSRTHRSSSRSSPTSRRRHSSNETITSTSFFPFFRIFRIFRRRILE